MNRLATEALLERAHRLRWTSAHTSDRTLAKAAAREADVAEAQTRGFRMNDEEAADFDERPLAHSHLHDHPGGQDSAASYFRRHSHRHTHRLSALEGHDAPRRAAAEHDHGHVRGETAGDLYVQTISNGAPVGEPRLVVRGPKAEKSAGPDLAKRYRRLAQNVTDRALAKGYEALADELEEH